MKRLTLILFAASALVFGAPTFAQRPAHPGSSGPPSGRGPENGSGMSGAHESGTPSHAGVSHGSPSEVLSHNPVIGDKIQKLTGQSAQTACNGFKNIGQCVAAAHVAKNLDIPGGFDALKAKLTGSGAISLGKAIKQLAPDADSKAEAKKANKQAEDDLSEASS